MTTSPKDELIALTERLLASIAAGDWKTYAELCDESITCFEPEARGNLVSGLPFHQFYFDLGPSNAKKNTTLVAPHVRLLGDDAAVVSYVRLVQKSDASGVATSASEETRVWARQGGKWRHVHFHRSVAS
jgi:calcium/calmodulin-dependent protein kinase (CaM kinase) II